MNAQQWPAWNLDMCLRVRPRISGSVCAHIFLLTVRTLSTSFQCPPPHTSTHPTADTRMSPHQPDAAEDVLLTAKRRPPRSQHGVQLAR